MNQFDSNTADSAKVLKADADSPTLSKTATHPEAEHQDASKVPAEVAPTPTEAPDDMNKIVEWADKINDSLAKGVTAILVIGRQLIDAKIALGYGNFEKMVTEKVRFCPRQAQKYMRIAKSEVLSNPNYGSVLPRQVSILDKLVKRKPEVQTQILDYVQAIKIDDPILNIDSPQFWAPLFKLYPAAPNKSTTTNPVVADQNPQHPADKEGNPVLNPRRAPQEEQASAKPPITEQDQKVSEMALAKVTPVKPMVGNVINLAHHAPPANSPIPIKAAHQVDDQPYDQLKLHIEKAWSLLAPKEQNELVEWLIEMLPTPATAVGKAA